MAKQNPEEDIVASVKYKGEISAIVIRANGTVENLGVISRPVVELKK